MGWRIIGIIVKIGGVVSKPLTLHSENEEDEALDLELEHQTYQGFGHVEHGAQGDDVQQNENPSQVTQEDIAQVVEGQEHKILVIEMMMMRLMQPLIILCNEENPSLHLKRTNHIKTKKRLAMIVKT
ncbi:hypothetical protein ACH5RR_009083 [Cinchona calisaya]|uniref:Uncharacterized protein n=1 Tax=Cinchona calisaya TaxID=153742 RepID=A0ABD3ADA4_9GENT